LLRVEVQVDNMVAAAEVQAVTEQELDTASIHLKITL
jgi:hypothetical protein